MSEPLLVVASIYPMQYFAERVGGDRVEVVALVPPGAEGHTFELTASDLRTIGEADVIAMNGIELEPWLERALESLGDDVTGVVVEAADAEAALEFEDHEAEGDDHEEEEGEHHDEDEEEEEGEHHDEDEEEEEGEHHDEDEEEEEGEHHEEDEEEEEGEHHDEDEEEDHGDEEDGHGHGHGELDPHFWLDPLRAITQAERIAGALIEADPAGADVYQANLAALSSELRALHGEFETGLSSCAYDEFVTSHAAYGYLALAYGLEQVSVAGLSPGFEPSAQRLASIADRINDLGLEAVLVEPVLSGSNEQVLASETGAGIYMIHPMDGITQDELDEHGDYFGLMRDNLNSLRAAMECS
ncbi:MAG: zinc ABC transporter substrate-binding protein [Chloroflexota bacterium]|nr:zinc ABC transporter substrate-binding protein [Chloroflexota bacterium]